MTPEWPRPPFAILKLLLSILRYPIFPVELKTMSSHPVEFKII